MNNISDYLIKKGFERIENKEFFDIFNTKDIEIYKSGDLHIVILKENIAICMPSPKRILNEPTWMISAGSKHGIRNAIKQLLHAM